MALRAVIAVGWKQFFKLVVLDLSVLFKVVVHVTITIRSILFLFIFCILKKEFTLTLLCNRPCLCLVCFHAQQLR